MKRMNGGVHGQDDQTEDQRQTDTKMNVMSV